MPLPSEKTEQDLREAEIHDAVRAELELAVKAYRRRMLNATLPKLTKEFRETKRRTAIMPAIDASYRDHIRQFVLGVRAELTAGTDDTDAS